MRPKYYISCPITVPIEVLYGFANKLFQLGAGPSFWNREDPYRLQDVVDDCDGFVLVLPYNNFKMPVEELPIGCKRELDRALKAKRTIYLAYKNIDGYAIYQAVVNSSDVFTGISGTQGEIGKIIKREITRMNTENPLQAMSSNDMKGFNVTGNLSGLSDSINTLHSIPLPQEKNPAYLKYDKLSEEYSKYDLAVSLYDRRILLLV